MDSIRNRIKKAVDTLGELRYSRRMPVENVRIGSGSYEFCEQVSMEKLESMELRPYGRDETWGGRDRHYWFLARIEANSEGKGRQRRVILSTGDTDLWNTDNPQIMVYVDGQFRGTMDMNHQELILDDGEKEHSLAFYAYSNNKAKTNFFHLDQAFYEEDVAKLYYDMKVPFEAGELLPSEDLERIEAWKALNDCVNRLDLRCPGSPGFYQSVKEADAFLQEHYYADRKECPVVVHSIGHTHIDVAWKWPLKQTRQKAVRSFNTVLNLMDRYPEYRFMSSQPQLYQFVKEEAPKLFERIKEKIREGRWEAEGAAWVEPDCNLSSGEALVRQILYGRQFFEKELGAEPNEVLWLPDVFGYSAAMPQILKKSGISYFMTTKISWNEYNKFPYDTFMWKGIDGSEVLSYLITTKDYYKPNDGHDPAFNTTYNGRQNVSQIMGTWQRYQNKDLSQDVLTCFGHGDGGGGPTEEMLEESRRMESGVARCPKTRQTFVKEFFHLLEEKMDKKRLPSWNGELYLEFHRGTYTSMAKNKWYNRKSEFLCGDAELYSVMAMEADGSFAYPKKEMDDNWKLLLLNQFHDILPGSSIKEVYEDSAVQYEKILASGRNLIRIAKDQIMKTAGLEKGGNGLTVWNNLSFSRTDLVEMDREEALPGVLRQKTAEGSWLYVAEAVPSKGYHVYGGEITDSQAVSPSEAPACVLTNICLDEQEVPVKVETLFYKVEFNPAGEMTSIYDKREERELLKPGTVGNRITVFEDRPLEYDSWNIDATYGEHSWQLDQPSEFKVLENGPVRGCIYIKRSYLNSVVEQHIYFYHHTARIDFKTDVDWHEHQMLVKTAFPLDVLCSNADYEIQFGNVKRPTHKNTSWDQARFETCGHKWADISEDGYGVALLNDCKYGYDIHDSVMGLTLLKSGIFPNEEADQGHHEFTYGLFPHQGDFRRGQVVREAYMLNCPLEGDWTGKGKSDSYSFLQVREENVLLDTVKQAEDQDGVVLRLYEAYGRRTKVHVNALWAEGKEIWDCDCMENLLEQMECPKGSMEFVMKPYEIKTIKVKTK